MSESSERVRRHRERKKKEAEIRAEAERVSAQMLALYPDRDAKTEAGRADRAVAYARKFGLLEE